MSKTGQWYLQLTEDANDMTREEFIKKHGESNVDVWDSENEYDLMYLPKDNMTDDNIVKEQARMTTEELVNDNNSKIYELQNHLDNGTKKLNELTERMNKIMENISRGF